MEEVALVLGSGGARGLAHIGAIRAIEEHGYRISSIAGCSMGAIITGMYAAGRIDEAEQWFKSINIREMLRLTDFKLTNQSLIKGYKVIDALKEIVPDCRIEELPIPVSLSATDLVSGNEVVFTEGSLYDAIRASMSIPLVFEPVERDGMLLVDGGIVNPLPLNRVKRHKGDLLVAVNISGHDRLDSTDINLLKIADRMADVEIENTTRLSLGLYPPDILVTMRHYAFESFDFDRADEIIAEGYRLTKTALANVSKHV